MKNPIAALASRLKSKPKPVPDQKRVPEALKPVPLPVPDQKQPPVPSKPVPVPVPDQKQVPTAAQEPTTPEPVQGRRVPGTKRQRKFERQVGKARKAIQSGAIQPKTREVAEHCEAAYRTALSILATLTTDGVIVRDGRGWKLPDSAK